MHLLVSDLGPEDKAKGFANLEFLKGVNWVTDQAFGSLKFTSANWATPQQVKFRAKADNAQESTRFVYVNHTITSNDTAYANAKLLSVKVQ